MHVRRVVFALAVAASCVDIEPTTLLTVEPIQAAPEVETSRNNPYAWVGKAHNEFQGVGLRAIRAAGGFSGMTRTQAFDILRSECVEFMRARSVSPVGCHQPEFLTTTDATASIASPEQLQYYYDALYDITDDGLSISAYQSAVVNLENQVLADPEIDETESNDFMITAAVAYDSYEYWQQSTSWEPLYDPETNNKGFWDWFYCTIGFGVPNAIQWDIGGAIVGGLAGAGVASGGAAILTAGACADPPW